MGIIPSKFRTEKGGSGVVKDTQGLDFFYNILFLTSVCTLTVFCFLCLKYFIILKSFSRNQSSETG